MESIEHGDPESPGWSLELTHLTRQFICFPPSHTGLVLCMKNFNGQFADIILSDLLDRKIKLIDKNSHEIVIYDSVESLICAGWAVD